MHRHGDSNGGNHRLSLTVFVNADVYDPLDRRQGHELEMLVGFALVIYCRLIGCLTASWALEWRRHNFVTTLYNLCVMPYKNAIIANLNHTSMIKNLLRNNAMSKYSPTPPPPPTSPLPPPHPSPPLTPFPPCRLINVIVLQKLISRPEIFKK